MLAPKVKTPRSEKYRRYVASQDCFSCGISGYSQCAHANQGRGLGQKASDFDTFPLCCTRPGHQGCHVLHDQLVDITLDQRRRMEVIYVARMQQMAQRDGVLKSESAEVLGCRRARQDKTKGTA